MTFKASKYDALPEGLYDATLTDIAVGENDLGGYRKWHFEVGTPEGKRDLSAMTSDASGPQSKAYGWATTLLGHTPGDQEEQLRGLRCRLHLVVNDSGYNRIAALLPPGGDSLEGGVAAAEDDLSRLAGDRAVARPRGQGTLNLERVDDQVYRPYGVPEVTF